MADADPVVWPTSALVRMCSAHMLMRSCAHALMRSCRMVTMGVALRGYAGEPAAALADPDDGWLGVAAFLVDKVRTHSSQLFTLLGFIPYSSQVFTVHDSSLRHLARHLAAC